MHRGALLCRTCWFHIQRSQFGWKVALLLPKATSFTSLVKSGSCRLLKWHSERLEALDDVHWATAFPSSRWVGSATLKKNLRLLAILGAAVSKYVERRNLWGFSLRKGEVVWWTKEKWQFPRKEGKGQDKRQHSPELEKRQRKRVRRAMP